MQIILEPHEKEILQRALEKWGTVDQLFQAMEELGECITVINHYRRGRVDDLKVYDEFADAFIMLSQIAIMMDSDNGISSIESKVQYKLNRLKARLDNVTGEQDDG